MIQSHEHQWVPWDAFKMNVCDESDCTAGVRWGTKEVFDYDVDDTEITTVGQLVRAVSNSLTGGYEVDFEIKPNMEKSRAGDGFFLVIEVHDSEPDSTINGEWWFDADDRVMQVL